MKNKQSITKNFFSKIPSFLCYVYFVYVILTIFLLASFPFFIKYILSVSFSEFNYIFLIVAIICLIAFIGIVYILRKKTNVLKLFSTNKCFYIIVILISLIMFIWQLFLILNIEYMPISDVEGVTFFKFEDFSLIESDVDTTSNVHQYFAHFPNLRVITGLYLFVYNIFKLLSIPMFAYFAVQILSSLWIILSVVLGSLIIKKLLGNSCSIFAFLLSWLFIGFSPLCVVPYTDTIALLFTVLILFVFVCLKKPCIKWSLVFALTIIGYSIKPTVVAVFIAILIVEFCYKFINNKKAFVKKSNWTISWLKLNIKNIVSVLLSCILAFLIIVSLSNFGFARQPEKEFSPTHYLMMGLNPYSYGQYHQFDYELSNSIENYDERVEKNWEIINERLNDYRFVGIVQLLGYKSIGNYESGNFIPKNFYKLNIMGNENLINAVYNFNDNDEAATDNLSIYNICTQILWFIILITCCISLYFRKNNKYLDVVIISLLEISIFLLIFESSVRYLFLYSEFFVILSTFGIKFLINKFSK